MTQSNLLELAQQGDPQAIAALMNQSLQPRGMTATVERLGDRLSVLLEADQVPNRQTLTAFVHRGISNLGIESIRSVKVLGQQTGTNLPVWTQDLTLELPTTAAEAIDAVDLSPPVDSRVDLPLADIADDDELEALWIAPSDEQSQDSLADLLAEEPTDDDLQGLFDDQPEEFEPGIGVDNPLEDLRSMFGEQSEADFPPLEESSFSGTDLNSMDSVKTNSLQDLFGEDPDADPLSQLDGMFSEPTFTESSSGFTNDLDSELDQNSLDRDLLDSDLLNSDLSNDLGLESNDSDSLADLFGDRVPEEYLSMSEETPVDEEEFQDLFGETNTGVTSEDEALEGLLEQPMPEAIAPDTWSLLDEELPSQPSEEFETDNQSTSRFSEERSVLDEDLFFEDEDLSISDLSPTIADEQFASFSDEESAPDLSFLEESASEETLLGEPTEEDSLLDFMDQESEQSEDLLSEDLLGERFAGVETSEPTLFNDSYDAPGYSALESDNESLLFDEPSDEPGYSRPIEAGNEPLLFDELGDESDNESLLFDEPSDEPGYSRPIESDNEPLLFDEPIDEPSDEPGYSALGLDNESLLFDEPSDEPSYSRPIESDNEPLLFDEPIDEPSDEPGYSALELDNESLLFDEPSDELGDSIPIELGNEPLLFDDEPLDEPLLFGEPHPEPVSFNNVESIDEESVDEPLLSNDSRDELVSFADLESADEPSLLEPEPSFANISSSSTKSFQEQQALADFFADDPLADFLGQTVPPPREEFLEGGLSEPMAEATDQDYFNSPEPSRDFSAENLNSVLPLNLEPEEEQDSLNGTFQPADSTDLFSERMGSLESEFPQDLQVEPLESPDRSFLGNDDIASLDNWDRALENPLPDVEINQADASSLESLTDDPDLYNLQTEAAFGESSLFDRHPQAEPDTLPEFQPNRWDLDSDDEPTAIESPFPPAVGAFGGRTSGVGALEDLTISLPNLPDEGYEQPVAYPSLTDPTQAPPQPKGSPWIFPLVLFGLTGWILALIGLSYFLKDRDTTQPPIVQPSAGSPAPSVPSAPLAPASPSSVVPGSEDSAALPQTPDWMAVD